MVIITIDTSKDDQNEIRRAIGFLQEALGAEPSAPRQASVIDEQPAKVSKHSGADPAALAAAKGVFIKDDAAKDAEEHPKRKKEPLSLSPDKLEITPY